MVKTLCLMGNKNLHLSAIMLGIIVLFSGTAMASTNAVKNFSKSVYGAANQNWSATIAGNGFIYFANHRGLLEFDGAGWRLMSLPHETILRAVFASNDTVIYTAGYRELGYWKAGKNQMLSYTSLNQLAQPYFSKNEEFWNICGLDDKIFFQSFAKILVYQNGRITPVGFPGFVNTMKRVNDKILVAVDGHGIYSMKDSIPELVISSPLINNSTIRFILPYRETGILIGTATRGVFVWDGIKLEPWLKIWEEYFAGSEVNRAHITREGDIIIGTITDGITMFSQNGEFLARLNTNNGLQNNTVLGITSDSYGNIWLALDNGIDFISADSSYSFMIENIGEAGSVYDAALFEGRLYLGTNQGLFFRDLQAQHKNYELMPQAQGQVWFCREVNNHLLVGYNGGLLAVKNNQVKKISSQAGAFCIREDPAIRESYVVSTYSNLVRLSWNGSEFRQDKLISGFFDLIRYIEFDHRGNLWASHMHRGIYKLQFNPARDSIVMQKYFGQGAPFKKDHSIHVFKVENRIVFTTGDSLYTYDDIKDTIIPYEFLNQAMGRFSAATRIIAGPDHRYWIITKEEIGLFTILNNAVELVDFMPRALFKANALIDDFENLCPVSRDEALLCLENGISGIRFPGYANSPVSRFSPALREVTVSGPRVGTTTISPVEGTITVSNKYHTIRIRYSFPHYTHFPVSYRAKLEGLGPEWSAPASEPVFSFDRLPEGTYRLLVMASDPWGNESQVEQVSLVILPPWYLSSLMTKVYIFLVLVLFFGLQAWAIKRTRKKERQHLEKREKELIKLRNEKLRNEVEYKSKELANLTMAIVKKNEFLLDLKEIFTHQKEQLGTRYPDKYFNHISRKIDENISSHDDWNLFETNFERAHEQFLQKLKTMFPELTPKDLRLSAYLRMNLSSKEIAPLLGISVRGVENHRYRLRKKMGLDHDDNLIEMILKL